MALKPCRACSHTVDTSAKFCPECGATRPAHKLSAQMFNHLILIAEIILGCTLLYVALDKIWTQMAPIVQMQLQKAKDKN